MIRLGGPGYTGSPSPSSSTGRFLIRRHRSQLFLLEHLSFVGARAPEQQLHPAKAWVMASWATVRPCGSGRVYPNFPDPDLDDWGQAYYGANYARLVKIKAKYDPHGVFRFPQSLPAQ